MTAAVLVLTGVVTILVAWCAWLTAGINAHGHRLDRLYSNHQGPPGPPGPTGPGMTAQEKRQLDVLWAMHPEQED